MTFLITFLFFSRLTGVSAEYEECMRKFKHFVSFSKKTEAPIFPLLPVGRWISFSLAFFVVFSILGRMLYFVCFERFIKNVFL